jgi:fatty-acid peroxygenase
VPCVTADGHRTIHLDARARRVMLDLHGVNHDPRIWENPQRFEPERFRKWSGDPFDFMPQGGGEHASGHRCAGEGLTIDLMKTALRVFTQRLAYTVPPQDLTVDSSRLPALPRSKLIIENVRIRS